MEKPYGQNKLTFELLVAVIRHRRRTAVGAQVLQKVFGEKARWLTSSWKWCTHKEHVARRKGV